MGSLILIVLFREGEFHVTFLPIGVFYLRNAAESIDHLLLYCSVCLWIQIFREASLSWDSPVYVMLYFVRERFKFLGDKKRVVVYGRCGMIAIFWVVWVERNRRAFNNVKGEIVYQL